VNFNILTIMHDSPPYFCPPEAMHMWVDMSYIYLLISIFIDFCKDNDIMAFTRRVQTRDAYL
jgi:hypothetical protein